MKTISAETQSILAGRQFYKADCYTFTLAHGGATYLTTWGQNLTLGSTTYQAAGPGLTRSQLSQKIGLEVAGLTVTLYPKPSDLLNGVPWLAALQQGQLDGATVTLTRAFMATPGDTSGGGVLMFSGRVAEVRIGRTEAGITVNAWTELLSIKMPRNIYQSGCGWTLFDSGCGVSQAAYGVNGIVETSPTTLGWYHNLGSYAGNYFALGQLKMTSGAASGQARTVSYNMQNPNPASGYVQLIYPLTVPPAIGDTFTVWPGCDKSRTTCANKFGNLGRYRGFPFIPAPETAV